MKRKLKEGCCEILEGQAWNSKRGDKRKKKSIRVKPKKIKLHMPPIYGGLAMTYQETSKIIFFFVIVSCCIHYLIQRDDLLT